MVLPSISEALPCNALHESLKKSEREGDSSRGDDTFCRVEDLFDGDVLLEDAPLSRVEEPPDAR